MVLKHPGLGQGLTARLKERAHFDRVRPVDNKVELSAPMALDAVGNGFDELVRPKTAARGRHDKFWFDAKREISQRSSQELDHEFPHALRARQAGLSSASETGRPYRRKL